MICIELHTQEHKDIHVRARRRENDEEEEGRNNKNNVSIPADQVHRDAQRERLDAKPVATRNNNKMIIHSKNKQFISPAKSN